MPRYLVQVRRQGGRWRTRSCTDGFNNAKTAAVLAVYWSNRMVARVRYAGRTVYDPRTPKEQR